MMDKDSVVDFEREETQSQLQEKYLEALDKIEDGSMISGTIAQVTNDTVFVDVGYKSEGRLPISDFKEVPKVGDVIEVLVVKKVGKGGMIQLSHRVAREKATSEELENAFKEKTPVEGKFISVIKAKEGDKISGYEVSLCDGYKGFCPFSKADIHKIDIPESLLGTREYFIVEKFYKNPKVKSVVNRRDYLQAQIDEVKNEFFNSVSIGDVVEGKVTTFTNFGVFFDLGGFDGLLHLNDISWGHVSKIKDIFKKGDSHRLRVIDVDRENKKINLSLKDMTEDPWLSFESKYKLDDVVTGKVVKLTQFGIFVEIEPGIDGLAHISELSWTLHINHPSEVYKVGDTVQAKIKGYDVGAHRVSLGVRDVQENPWNTITEKYPIGSKLDCKVIKITQNGAFLCVEEGIDGFLPADTLSWTDKTITLKDVFKEGDVKTVIVTKVDPVQRRIRLSLRDPNVNPWVQLKTEHPKGSIIEVEVEEVSNNALVVKVTDEIKATINKGAVIPSTETALLSDLYKQGDKVKAVVVDINSSQNKIILSVRDALEEERKNEYAKYMKESTEDDSSYTLADILDKKDN